MKFSISSFVHYRFTLPDAIRRYGSLGFDQVEIWGGRPHAYPEDMEGEYLKETLSALEETGLGISNFIPAQFRYPTNLASSVAPMRQASIDYICRSIDTALKLGAPSVSICPGYSLSNLSRNATRELMLDSFTRIIEYAPDDFLILIEPANLWESDLIVTVDDGCETIEILGKPKNLGLCIDSGHMHINREILSDAPLLFGRFPLHFHIDDNNGRTDDHLVPGEGLIDHSVFLNRLITSGYKGSLAVELGFGYTPDPDPAAKRSLEYLRTAVAAAGNTIGSIR